MDPGHFQVKTFRVCSVVTGSVPILSRFDPFPNGIAKLWKLGAHGPVTITHPLAIK